MAFTVTLQPGDLHFVAEEHESLLNAALRAGLALDYRCSNGNCGHCQASLLQGQVVRLRSHDFQLAEQGSAQQQILLCCYAAASDLIIEAETAHSPADIPVQYVEAKIRRKQIIDDHTLILQLRTPRSQSLRFIAGQHACLQLENGLQRELPIASCPCDGMNLEFHVHRDAADKFGDYLFDQIGNTDKIHIEGPVGNFTLDESSTHPILFIAWETGFGPIRSLIEHCLSLELTQPLQLYWIVHHSRGHYADGYCRAVSDAIDNFSYTPLCVPEINSAIQQIAFENPDLSQHQVYIAMPPAVAEKAVNYFQQQGMQPHQVKIDPLVA